MQDQTQIALYISLGCLVTFFLVIVIILFVVTYQRKMLEKEGRIRAMEQEQQILFFKATVEAEENQKEKIANNLHDSVNPMLTLLKLNLSKHRLAFQKNKFDVEEYKKDSLIIDQAIESIRATCRDLIPSFLLEFGLIKSLEDYVFKLNVGENVITRFENKLPETAIPDYGKQEQLIIYRVCLELMNNLIKHAGFTELIVELDAVDGNMVIRILHDGRGVNNAEVEDFTAKSKGLGLRSLKARVLLLNAKLDYIKQDPNSFVKLSIPLAA